MSTGKLAGKTLFITGASRGIGKAIALRAAQDGANIVVAAKTAEPHPKLPGTVFTAAKEIEEAGGRSLPCVVDIRDEDAVHSAVENAVAKFGGIDILINNASAISLTGTLETPMKKYDLMNSINARGTYLCSRVCLPHLKKGSNPHILNISPPLNMNPKWFKGHVAYTMAKYGMSMCVLGMAEELRSEGVAVNALWPKTAIATAAMEMLAGSDYLNVCRKVDIMSDAAYSILTKDSRSFTAKFLIDEDVLKADGVTDFDQYNCVPGSNPMPDFFLDVDVESGDSSGQKSVGSSEIYAVFDDIKKLLNEELVQKTNGVFQFDLTGNESGTWFLDLKNATGSAGEGAPDSPNVTMTMDSGDFVQMFTGKLKPTQAFMAGKLKIKGDMMLAMKLEKLMKKKSQL